ncbi:MAG: helix-turn-helix domain-containing protein [Spirochaetaceae bacterium]
MSDFYTPKQLAERWNVSLPTIRRMIKRRELEVLRLSSNVLRVPVSEVERVEEERRQERKGARLRELYGRE